MSDRSRFSIPNDSDEDICEMLKDCNMDTRESSQRLFFIDLPRALKRKHDRTEVGRFAIPRSSLVGCKNRSPSSSDAKYLEEVQVFNLRLDKIKGVVDLITRTSSCVKDFHTKWNNDKKEKLEEKRMQSLDNEISAILELCQDLFQNLKELVLRIEDIKDFKVELKEPSLDALKIALRQLKDVPSFDIVGYEPATSKDSQWEKPDPEDIKELEDLKIEERILMDLILFFERHLKAADEKAADESSEDPLTTKNEEKRELVKLLEEKLREYMLAIEDLEKRIPKDIEGLRRDQYYEEVVWEGQIKLEFRHLRARAKLLLKELDDNDVEVKDNDG